MRELNRLGVTSASTPAGDTRTIPKTTRSSSSFIKRGEMTVRIAYNLFTQKPRRRARRLLRWSKVVKPDQGDDSSVATAPARCWFSRPRISRISSNRAPNTRKHGRRVGARGSLSGRRIAGPSAFTPPTKRSINRSLGVYEKVNREVPLRWAALVLRSCETISHRNIERIKALGGGIAVQHRMAYQGEYFIDRYGSKAAERTPPLREHA